MYSSIEENISPCFTNESSPCFTNESSPCFTNESSPCFTNESSPGFTNCIVLSPVHVLQMSPVQVLQVQSSPGFTTCRNIRCGRTRVNNVSQSARLFTFCVLNQSECVKLSIITTKGVKNSTLF